MRRRILQTVWPLMAILTLATGCRKSTDCGYCGNLETPYGVYTITGDGLVEIFWDEIDDGDLAGYNVYRSYNAEGPYERIGRSGDGYFVDGRVTNAITYYYAVTAYDRHGHETELSHETVHDTPRPAGTGLVVYDDDDWAGVDFSRYDTDMVLPWDDVGADMFLFWDGEDYAMASTDVYVGGYIYGTDLQGAGYVNDLDELDWAPVDGWSTSSADSVVMREGHAYWVWTWDGYFAKFRVRSIGYDFVVLDWAYQSDQDNPELVVMALPGSAAPPIHMGKRARNTKPLAPDAWQPGRRSGRSEIGSRERKEVLP